MAAFDRDADLENQRDWRLLANGFVHLYWRPSLLAEIRQWLVEKGYRVVSLDASGWETEADFHREIAEALEFPTYYGRNLDALNNCLSDVVAYSYGSDREAAGTVLVLAVLTPSAPVNQTRHKQSSTYWLVRPERLP